MDHNYSHDQNETDLQSIPNNKNYEKEYKNINQPTNKSTIDNFQEPKYVYPSCTPQNQLINQQTNHSLRKSNVDDPSSESITQDQGSIVCVSKQPTYQSQNLRLSCPKSDHHASPVFDVTQTSAINVFEQIVINNNNSIEKENNSPFQIVKANSLSPQHQQNCLGSNFLYCTKPSNIFSEMMVNKVCTDENTNFSSCDENPKECCEYSVGYGRCQSVSKNISITNACKCCVINLDKQNDVNICDSLFADSKDLHLFEYAYSNMYANTKCCPVTPKNNTGDSGYYSYNEHNENAQNRDCIVLNFDSRVQSYDDHSALNSSNTYDHGKVNEILSENNHFIEQSGSNGQWDHKAIANTFDLDDDCKTYCASKYFYKILSENDFHLAKPGTVVHSENMVEMVSNKNDDIHIFHDSKVAKILSQNDYNLKQPGNTFHLKSYIDIFANSNDVFDNQYDVINLFHDSNVTKILSDKIYPLEQLGTCVHFGSDFDIYTNQNDAFHNTYNAINLFHKYNDANRLLSENIFCLEQPGTFVYLNYNADFFASAHNVFYNAYNAMNLSQKSNIAKILPENNYMYYLEQPGTFVHLDCNFDIFYNSCNATNLSHKRNITKFLPENYCCLKQPGIFVNSDSDSDNFSDSNDVFYNSYNTMTLFHKSNIAKILHENNYMYYLEQPGTFIHLDSNSVDLNDVFYNAYNSINLLHKSNIAKILSENSYGLEQPGTFVHLDSQFNNFADLNDVFYNAHNGINLFHKSDIAKILTENSFSLEQPGTFVHLDSNFDIFVDSNEVINNAYNSINMFHKSNIAKILPENSYGLEQPGIFDHLDSNFDNFVDSYDVFYNAYNTINMFHKSNIAKVLIESSYGLEQPGTFVHLDSNFVYFVGSDDVFYNAYNAFNLGLNIMLLKYCLKTDIFLEQPGTYVHLDSNVDYFTKPNDVFYNDYSAINLFHNSRSNMFGTYECPLQDNREFAGFRQNYGSSNRVRKNYRDSNNQNNTDENSNMNNDDDDNQNNYSMNIDNVSENQEGKLDIKFLSLNVGGIDTKLRSPDLLEVVKQHDIICLVETKMDELDNLSIDGYTCFLKNRKKFVRKSGGVAVIVKNNLLKYVKIVEHANFNNRINPTLGHYYRFVHFPIPEESIIFELRLPSMKPIVCSTVYVPPQGSPYMNRDLFQNLSDTLSYWHDNDYLILGDFNARTAHILEYDDDDDEHSDVPNMVDIMKQLGIKRLRANCDLNTNVFCDLFMEFCKSHSMLIVNGRVGSDAFHGRCTCSDVSTVDYIVASPSLFTYFSSFYVDDFDALLSDRHCPLILTISVYLENENAVNDRDENVSDSQLFSTKPVWKNENRDIFINHIDQGQINAIEQRLTETLRIENVNQADINSVTKDLNNLILSAAENSDMLKTNIHKGKRKKYKNLSSQKLPWFDFECSRKRNILRRARRVWSRNKNNRTERIKIDAYNSYKLTLNRKFKSYYSTTHNNLRKARKLNGKKYWNTLNNCFKSPTPNNIPSQDEFIRHFENLSNIPENEILNPSNDNLGNNLDNTLLNNDISADEVLKAIRKLKNDKACGLDKILNEFLKASSSKLINAFTLLFNLVLNSGIVPEDWSVGVIHPLYKGKGDTANTDNYRGITILSCVGKLFTSVLNARIYEFLDKNDLLGIEQGGFRPGNSTIDHIFALHCIIELYLQKKKKLYCTFIDYSKAFDRVQRNILWDKLLNHGINGKILTVIKDIYSKTKTCVITAKGTSNYFFSNVGVKQGENLSPILFSLFLNDLKSYLSPNIHGLSLPKNLAENLNFLDIQNFVHLFLILYADDTVILAETITDMQKALDNLNIYCKMYGLHINVSKTKVLVFSRGKIRNIPNFNFDSSRIDVVFQYKYLGITLNYNNKMNIALKTQCLSSNKAIFSVLKKARALKLPIDIQLDMFDKCVKPILLYGSEIWGCVPLDEIDKIQTRFLKMMLGIRKSTTTCILLGELGCFPVSLDAKCRLLCYWYKLCLGFQSGSTKLSIIMFRLCSMMYDLTDQKLQWMKSVHSLLDNLGLSFIWLGDWTWSLQKFKSTVKQRLKDQYIQSWFQSVQEKDICITYRIFKTNFAMEDYILKLSPILRTAMLKFRASLHKLPIQSLRYVGVPRVDRICHFCNKNEMGDEFHYLFQCTHPELLNARHDLLPNYYIRNPNIMKMQNLFKTKSLKKMIKLSRFVSYIMKIIN